jgi:hypothetical protein
MAIDASIYGLLDTKGLQQGLAGIGEAYASGQERKNRLAQLAQQQELGGLQIEKAKQEAAMYPQQLAEQKRAKEAQYMQGVSREIAQSPENMAGIIEKHAKIAPQVGIDPSHLTWLASDLSKATDIKDLQSRAMYHANPQEYEKEALKAQFEKGAAGKKIQVDNTGTVHIVNELTGEATPVIAQGKPMKAQPPASLVSIGNPNWETKTDAAGNLIQVNPKTGETRDIGLKGKSAPEKALTEGQTKAFMFGTRAQNSHKILDEIGDKYSPMAVNTAMAVENVPGLNALANINLSEKDQNVMQAQRDFVNATLRQESGASIAKSEFQNAQKQYFPQPGDSKAVIEQKRKNRELVIEGFKVGAGPAASKFESTKLNEQSHPQDNAAVTWAKANPNDPRSAAILRVNGVK